MSPKKPKIPWERDDQGWDRMPERDTPDPPWPGLGQQGPSWVALKFGGTSMSGAGSAAVIAEVLRERLASGERPLVVCSALSGVTTALERLLEQAESEGQSGGGMGTLEWIRQRHVDQAQALGVPLGAECEGYLEDLQRFAQGVGLLKEISPRLRARTLSAGELLSTRLLAAYLSGAGLPVLWVDARELLVARARSSAGQEILGAQVQAREAALSELPGQDIVLTQGFIARDRQGETVLLGRGGSDTSAAILAAHVGACRLEIWTDVPGLFSANPQKVPSARLLRQLDYDEAQELATTGAKVLHPRCIAPLRAQGIPLHIHSTLDPELPGTVVGPSTASGAAQVKAVSVRKGVQLVLMDTLGMWQQVGFLADAFGVFKRHGVSIDLVATSETNVTVTLDASAQALAADTLDRLLEDLEQICSPRLIQGAAVVSLVGRRIRAILHKLGPVFERFEDQRVHLMSQAASDLNLSFVVPEEQADALVSSLHERLFRRCGQDAVFGASWAELSSSAKGPVGAWWVERRLELLAEAGRGTPCYFYDLETLRDRAEQLLALPIDRLLFAVKANPHPQVLTLFAELGLGFECVSPGELERVRHVCGDALALLTPNFSPAADYARGFELGAQVTLDSVAPLRLWPQVFAGRDIFVRVDPGRGDGHHPYVMTAGAQSKFGVPPQELAELRTLCQELDVRVVGLHAHSGSGSKQVQAWQDKAAFLLQLSQGFEDLRVLDLGGGLGVPERADAAGMDLEALGAVLCDLKAARPELSIWIEPGRFLVSEAGVLLTQVSQVKDKGERLYVGVDAGMHTLLRPALYGAWHEIVNLSRLDQPGAVTADVVGPICETGDVLGHERYLPRTESGDVLLVGNAGAYGASMSSDYNLRGRAREVLG